MATAKKKPPKKPKPKKKVGKPPPPKEPPTPPGARIGFRTTDGSVSQVVCFRGETSAVLSDGVGGWDVEDRPRRVAATIWVGSTPFRTKVPILFDGWRSRSIQEDEMNRLVQMGLPEGGQNPPQIKVSGGTPGDHYTWVIEGIEWGTNVIRDFDQNGTAVRYRQDATVDLLQHIKPTLTRTTGGGLPSKNRYYTFKKGDTLRKIAAKFYRDAKQWRKIAKANNIRDPRTLKQGKKLRIP